MNRVIYVTGLTLWSMGSGKGASSFYKSVKKYVDEGWEVFFISNKKENDNIDFLPKSNIIYVEPSVFEKYTKIKKIGLIFRILNNLVMNKRYYKMAKRYTNDTTILYAYEILGVKALKKLSQDTSRPLVTRFQGTIVPMFKKGFMSKIRHTPHFSALATKADIAIMTNDGTQGDKVFKELKNQSDKILFFRNGLDLMKQDISEMKDKFDKEKFKLSLGIKKKELVFVTLSRLVKWKKVERTIIGFSEYLANNNDGKLVIVGDGENKENLISLTKKLNISDNVIFVGSVEQNVVYEYIMACDIFSSLYDLSNVGNPLLEAMTLGACIVTLNVGDTNQLIENGKNGVLLNSDEIHKLPKVYEELSKNKELRTQLGNNASKFAMDNFYTWEKRMDMEFEEVKKLLL